MMRLKGLLLFVVTVAISLLSSVTVAPQAFAGKPTPPPPPPLPPVRYVIDLFQPGYINDVNNHQQVVGWYDDPVLTRVGFLYDNVTNSFTDLDDLVPGQVPTGWHIGSGVDINDSGAVTGYLLNAAGDRQAYVIDDVDDTPTLIVLPAPPGAYSYGGSRINTNGDVLGNYGDYGAYGTKWLCLWKSTGGSYAPPEILSLPGVSIDYCQFNDVGTVVGMLATGGAFHYDVPTDVWAAFPEDIRAVRGLNNSNTFCGDVMVGTTRVAFRYGSQLEQIGPTYGNAINAQNDVVFDNSTKVGKVTLSKSYLSHVTTAGTTKYKVDDLIHPNDPTKTLFVGSGQSTQTMSDADATGFGQIVGKLTVTNADRTTTSYGFILTPVAYSNP